MSRLERISVQDWLERGLEARGSVETLAANCGVSRRQLQRFIQKRWGVVPVVWLNEVRLNHAPLLLRQGLTVKEVAAMLGYESASHFARVFKLFHGMLPSEYGADEQ